jgi:hypothetical protein
VAPAGIALAETVALAAKAVDIAPDKIKAQAIESGRSKRGKDARGSDIAKTPSEGRREV